MGNKKNFIIGGSLIAVLGIATIVSTQLPKGDDKPTHAAAKNTVPKEGEAGLPFSSPPGNTKLPNTAELNKLNVMQAEIAKMTDDDINKEIESIKTKAQELGIVGTSRSSNPDLTKNQEAKDMMMRMALLRVEKAKRLRKPGGVVEKQDS